MTVLTTANISEIYHILYPDGIINHVLPASPMLGLMGKWNGFYGASKYLDWMIDAGGGAHSTFSVAQAQAGVPDHEKPNIVRKPLYAVRQLAREAMLASKRNPGALVDAMKHQTETAILELKKRAGSLIWGDGTGAIGQISSGSTVGSATITLSDATQVINFRKNGVYNTFTTGDSAVNVGDVTLTVVNEDSGALSCGTTWSAQSTGVAASDYIVPSGDYLAVPSGIMGWNPTTLPTSAAVWFGVDRQNSVAMCGQRYSPSAGSIDEVILDALAMFRGEADSLFINPLDWGSFAKQAGNFQRINKNAIGANGKPIASVSYQAIVVNGPKGAVNVYADQNCPRYVGKLMNISDFQLWSLGNPFELITEGMGTGGAIALSSADGVEIRFGGYWNTVFKNMRNVMHIGFPA